MSDTDRYAVFGNPIKHSKSPAIHAAFARQCDQPIQYRAVLVAVDGFEAAVRRFFAEGGAGLNVTVPFKREAFELAQRLSSRARRAGAVNTLTRTEDGALAGDNTDGVGLVRDMVANLGWLVQGQRVLVLGAGGAARGVLEPLLRENPRELVVVNRTPARAEQLAAEFAEVAAVEGGPFELLSDRAFDLIINATSAGLTGDMPQLPESILTERSCCYDMVYGAQPTPFMRWAAHHAAWAVADGLGMLVEQAAESFYIWRRVRPDTRPVIRQIREALAA
ncbi:MAG: shikimate dehydrogenase [Pseudomonadales bacterium]|nr:shikimate dehydrogenase [Halieaceae bacterium]MCP5163630.1 shikimate dehydrogenase [Pseudomonadales bacterium]MCP5189254.1 shikimate dehydrogenase [Pseudomonadales bacterium]MCP5204486.1 shikimate dehydrogenase [Pseudomonadales bacterium]